MSWIIITIYINITSFVLISQLEKDHSMIEMRHLKNVVIEMRHLKNVVIFFQTINNIVLNSRTVSM